MWDILLALGASLGTGLLIGLERERHPSALAGARTFALLALLGALAALLARELQSTWLVPIGLAAVAATVIAAPFTQPRQEEPGTTTVVAACVTYLLGALAGIGEPGLAGSLGIGITALLYFKPEIEGLSTALKRSEQVSILQFLVASFIVLPILPDEAYGPYAVLNPRNIWLMVVLISGIGVASFVALRVAGPRRGTVLAGILGGLVSSTATSVLYAKRTAEAPQARNVAAAVVPLANLVPLVRISVIALVIAPAILPYLLPAAIAALAAGAAATALSIWRTHGHGAPIPESRNPAELGVALPFAAFYALVLFASAWLSDLAGRHGLYATAAASGMVDVDAITLSSLNLFGAARLAPGDAVAAIAIAYGVNVLFKLGIVAWYDRRLALQVAAPMLATAAGGALAFVNR
jgi:uncharacterized membrane protein (DUF4010 family)